MDRIRALIGKPLTSWLMKSGKPHKVPPCDFERIKHELKVCDVLLIEGQSRVSNVIKYVTESPWSHATLYIGRLHDIEDPEIRRLVIERYKGDPHEQLLIEGELGRGTYVAPLSMYKHDHIRICRPKGLTHEDAQHVIGYCAKALGKSYSVRHILDLLRFLLPWRIMPKRWGSILFKLDKKHIDTEICSTLIAKAFASVSFPILPYVDIDDDNSLRIFPRNPNLFVPRDFDYSPYFEIIKYPIINVSDHAIYRKLPWSKTALASMHKDGSIELHHLGEEEEEEDRKKDTNKSKDE